MSKFKPGDTVFISNRRIFLDHRKGFRKATIIEITPEPPLTKGIHYTLLYEGAKSEHWPESVLYSTEEALAETLARD